MQAAQVGVVIASLVVLIPVLDHTHAEDQAEHNTGIIPIHIAESAATWIEGGITDSEFMSRLRAWLTGQEATEGINEPATLPDATQITESEARATGPTTKPMRVWMEDRVRWWTEGKITDEQFLSAVLYLNNSGFLKDANSLDGASTSQMPNDSTPLVDFLPTEHEIDRITKVTKWRFVTTEHGFDKTDGVADSVRILMRDINRVYDPAFNKYKIPTMSMQITMLAEQGSADEYWERYTNTSWSEVLDSAHMTGRILNDTTCLFNHSDDGAITACSRDDMVIQVVIFDTYKEHYFYGVDDVKIDETEPTTRIMDEIIRKINTITGRDANTADKLRHALQKTPPADGSQDAALADTGSDDSDSTQSVVAEPGMHLDTKNSTGISLQKTNSTESQDTADPEKTVAQGVGELVCTRDDFGIVTISGRYVNGATPSKQIDVEIAFMGWEQDVIGRAFISFEDVSEFEIREFLGHARWYGNFAKCHALADAR